MITLLLLAAVFHIPYSTYATNPNIISKPENSILACRTERGFYLLYDAFKKDACARCYSYMPYKAFKLKFRYDASTGALLDPKSNISYDADPFDPSSALLNSFFGESFDKWRACCMAAWDCCQKMAKEPPLAAGGVYCPRTWDGWQCWPDTEAGMTAIQPCQEHIYFEMSPPSCPKYASKECLPNGTWFLNENFREWTNYRKCGRRDEQRRYVHFHIAMHIISIVSIIPALIIFSVYKQLHVPRISMHKNLFLSLLLNAIAVVVFKSSVIAQELKRHTRSHPSILESNGVGCKILLILTRYFRMTNYMCMACEGYYLHKLIASAFAEQKSLLVFYITGWGLPVLFVGIYAIVRATLENERCWAYPVNGYEWITNAPNLLSLLVNLFFLCNIVRILVTKLRAAHANEPNQYRKAVRATLVLIPLFGLHLFLISYKPSSGKCELFETYRYFDFAMDGLQGFMVALTFCYLNGEVLYLLKRSYQRYKLQLQIQGSFHSSAILRRLSTTQDSTLNDSQNHHHHHHSNRTKYMENKLREINDQIKNKDIMNQNCTGQNNYFKV